MALASVQTLLLKVSRAGNGMRDTFLIDVELQSSLRVFNYDEFWEGKLEVFRSIL